MFARCLLETLNACIVTFITLMTLYAFGIDIFPADQYEAATAVAAAVYLGIGLGFFNVVVFSMFGTAGIISFTLIMIGLYLSSGAITPLALLPAGARAVLDYNPLMHCVQWLRYAYFHQVEVDLDRSYIIMVGSVFLFIGLLSERVIRGKLL